MAEARTFGQLAYEALGRTAESDPTWPAGTTMRAWDRLPPNQQAAWEAAAQAAAAAERECIARHLDSLAGNYPEDVFPATSDSRDAIGGTAMRHAYRNAARSVRTGEHYA